MNKCVVCEKEFCLVNNKGRKKRLTCSKDCLIIYKKQNAKKNRKLVVCKTCSKEEELPESFAKTYSYCSYDCRDKGLSIRYKNRVLTEQWIEKQNASKIKEKIVKYGIFNCEKCQKQFNTNTSLRAHKAKCSNKKWGNYICNKCNGYFNNPGALGLHDTIYHKNINIFPSISKAEISFLNKLKDALCDCPIEHNYKIQNINHIYDFYIPSKNLIIEFDGDYWHGNINLFPITARSVKQKNIDKYYTDKALQAGYDIVRVWDSEQNKFIKELLNGSQNNENSFNHKR